MAIKAQSHQTAPSDESKSIEVIIRADSVKFENGLYAIRLEAIPVPPNIVALIKEMFPNTSDHVFALLKTEALLSAIVRD